MSLERLPNRSYDLINQIERVDSDLSDFIKNRKIDRSWLKNVDHIGIETTGLDDFNEKFEQLSKGAVTAYIGEVYHQLLAAIEFSEGFQVTSIVENANWIELIGPKLSNIPASRHFRSHPNYPESDNIHFGFFNAFDQRAFDYFNDIGVEPESSSTPHRRAFTFNINNLGDSVQIMNKPLCTIIDECRAGVYDDVDLRQIKN